MNANWAARFLGLIIALAPFFGNALLAAEADAAPKKFSAAIGGFLGGSCTVEMTAPNTLAYAYNPHTFTGSPGTTRTTIKVTGAQWKAFRSHLDATKVWNWKARYENPNVNDGTVWDFTVDFGDKKITSTGNNAYPNQVQFDAVLAAVRELLGGKEFR